MNSIDSPGNFSDLAAPQLNRTLEQEFALLEGGDEVEAQMIQEMYHSMSRTEERIEALETMLLEKDGKERRSLTKTASVFWTSITSSS